MERMNPAPKDDEFNKIVSENTAEVKELVTESLEITE
jgi:hypothetical protein